MGESVKQFLKDCLGRLAHSFISILSNPLYYVQRNLVNKEKVWRTSSSSTRFISYYQPTTLLSLSLSNSSTVLESEIIMILASASVIWLFVVRCHVFAFIFPVSPSLMHTKLAYFQGRHLITIIFILRLSHGRENRKQLATVHFFFFVVIDQTLDKPFHETHTKPHLFWPPFRKLSSDAHVSLINGKCVNR